LYFWKKYNLNCGGRLRENGGGGEFKYDRVDSVKIFVNTTTQQQQQKFLK
jgi:hypothetical protein